MSTWSGAQHSTLASVKTHSPLALLALPLHWRWPAERVSVSPARKAVAEALPGLLRPACPQGAPPVLTKPGAECELIDILSLMASELVTNAVTHAPTYERTVEVSLWRADGMLWLAVSDCGEVFTVRRPAPADPLAPVFPDSESEHGRGLYLVEALADVWTVVPRPTTGKFVVAGLCLH